MTGVDASEPMIALGLSLGILSEELGDALLFLYNF